MGVAGSPITPMIPPRRVGVKGKGAGRTHLAGPGAGVLPGGQSGGELSVLAHVKYPFQSGHVAPGQAVL